MTGCIVRLLPAAFALPCDALTLFAKEASVATPNYSYEKRQRELAKKKKKEEKAARKAAGLPALPDEPEQSGEGAEPVVGEGQAQGDAPGA